MKLKIGFPLGLNYIIHVKWLLQYTVLCSMKFFPPSSLLDQGIALRNHLSELLSQYRWKLFTSPGVFVRTFKYDSGTALVFYHMTVQTVFLKANQISWLNWSPLSLTDFSPNIEKNWQWFPHKCFSSVSILNSWKLSSGNKQLKFIFTYAFT